MFKFIKSALSVKATKELEKEVEKELEKTGDEIDIDSIIRSDARRGVRSDSGVRSKQSGSDI